MRRCRQLLAAVLVALVAAACAPGLPDIVEADPVPADEAPAGGDDAATDDGDGAGEGQTDGAEGDGAADAPEPDADQQQPADPEQDATNPPEPAGSTLTSATEHGPVGSNGPAYLRGDRPRLVLEIDVQAGASLPGGVVDHVAAILARESNADVVVQQGAATATRRDRWTVAQLTAAAAETRDSRIDDGTVVMHLLVLRDAFERDGVLGVAFDATTGAVFPDQWSDLTSLLLSSSSIARAVTTHEAGHLLGLVGLAQPPTSGHEDPEHPGHTTDDEDVMFWAIETSLIVDLGGGPPTDFGPSTRADLAAMRAG